MLSTLELFEVVEPSRRRGRSAAKRAVELVCHTTVSESLANRPFEG